MKVTRPFRYVRARCSSFRKDQVAKPPWAYFPKTDFSISSAIGVCDVLIAGSP